MPQEKKAAASRVVASGIGGRVCGETPVLIASNFIGATGFAGSSSLAAPEKQVTPVNVSTGNG